MLPNDQIGLVETLLSRHRNLTVELSWIMLDGIVNDEGEVNPEWSALICNYPDQIVVGSATSSPPSRWRQSAGIVHHRRSLYIPTRPKAYLT